MQLAKLIEIRAKMREIAPKIRKINKEAEIDSDEDIILRNLGKKIN